jgi:hypothetical protein
MSWLIRIQRVLVEVEVLIGLLVFGLVTMVADLFADLGSPLAAIVRVIGLAFFVGYVAYIFWQRTRVLPVPLLFTEETDRRNARNMFQQFVDVAGLRKSIRVIESSFPLRQTDLVVILNRPNPRNCPDPDVWKDAWEELLREWEREVDRGLGRKLRCYHILPHGALPLSFALGASVGLRRRVILYHRQPVQEEVFRVVDLSEDPRQLFQLPSEAQVKTPEQHPANLQTLPQRDQLILHLLITERHVGNFQDQIQLHPDYDNADNVILAYLEALDPEQSWLPYVQHLFHAAQPLLNRYRRVDLCLLCPSAIAFALGMAFSRTPFITVCDWQNNCYVPVFSLTEIEEHLPFD